jgi:hypothetical protein
MRGGTLKKQGSRPGNEAKLRSEQVYRPDNHTNTTKACNYEKQKKSGPVLVPRGNYVVRRRARIKFFLLQSTWLLHATLDVLTITINKSVLSYSISCKLKVRSRTGLLE